MRIVLAVFCVMLVGGLTRGLAAVELSAAKINVLYMVADDLGYADTGFQGCKDVPTPNLDSLAANGVRFPNGYISCSVCSPSRAGLLTGRYQTRFGHEFNTGPGTEPQGLPLGVKTVGDFFSEAGYVTGQIGKWHIGDTRLPAYDPNKRGFTESVVFPGQNKLPPLQAWRNGKREKADDPYVDTAMGREAAAFIEKHQSAPWFLYVAFLTPHAPLSTSPDSEKPFTAIEKPNRRKNAAMISQLDQAVGRILKTVRDSGQEERTLIVFHSDNGAPPGDSYNTPLRGFKSTLLEGGLRVPFVMQLRGTLPAGRVEETPVISLDVLPTALAAAKVELPMSAKLDGVNLLPYLTNKSKEPPQRNLYWRYGEQYAIRSGNWKLVHSMDRVTNPPVYKTGLYDLSKDPTEAQDLAAAQPEKKAALQQQWDTWNADNVRPLWIPGAADEDSKPGNAKPKK
jgi:arylsulfatase A-like enzyme